MTEQVASTHQVVATAQEIAATSHELAGTMQEVTTVSADIPLSLPKPPLPRPPPRTILEASPSCGVPGRALPCCTLLRATPAGLPRAPGGAPQVPRARRGRRGGRWGGRGRRGGVKSGFVFPIRRFATGAPVAPAVLGLSPTSGTDLPGLTRTRSGSRGLGVLAEVPRGRRLCAGVYG
jgi:hypothetical protein